MNNWEQGVDYPSWMTEESLTTLYRQHLKNNETPKMMFQRIIDSVKPYSVNTEVISRWEQYFWNGWLSPATPIMANIGTGKGLPISCFIERVSDSIESIFDNAKQLALLTQGGGGVGITIDKIRGNGEPITDNGFSSGVVPFCKVYDSTVSAVSQAGGRRGAASLNLPVRHKDIEVFLNIRKAKGDLNQQCHNINHCITIDDYFMNNLKEGDEKSRDLWAKIISTRLSTGQPYIMYYHNVHNQRPNDMVKRNLKIDGTNICCLAGDTEVITKEGVFKIKDLVGKEVTIFDGNNWVKCNNFTEYPEDEIWEIGFSNDTYVRCNAKHRWFVDIVAEYIEKTTIELNIGDKLETDGAIVFVTYLEKKVTKEKVYCPQVPTTKKFLLANGIMTGNTEIMLPHDDLHTVVCCLSSVNIAKYDEWKDNPDFIKDSLYFLDCIIEYFIQNAKGKSGFEKAVRFAEKSRAIGLGKLKMLSINTFNCWKPLKA